MEKAIINTKRKKGKISKYIYGQFAEHLGRCIYEGLYVGEDSDIPNKNGMRCDVINALRQLDIPVLRWPGGCFADDYHWRDGIGPKEDRPYMVNTNWGGVVENNHFGTHEFFELCEQLGTEPYIAGNVGSGTVQEMRDWIEYMTFDGDSPLANERRKNGRKEPWKLKWFGVGNENWGCGGNMRPEYYSDLYKQYQTFIRNYGEEPIFKIACGPGDFNIHWSEVLMREQKHLMDGMSLHYYSMPGTWQHKGDSVNYDESEWYMTMASAMKMEKAVSDHTAVMDAYDPEKKVALIVDEWGTWFDVLPGTNPGFLYQQNTMRDVMVAVLTLHIFHNHCDRVRMANIAQLVNVLQSMVLTEGERMALTPTYHIFRMMKGHMDGTLIDVDHRMNFYKYGDMDIPEVTISASEKDGVLTVSAANTRLDSDKTIELEIRDSNIAGVHAELLTANDIHDCNTFDEPETVKPSELNVKSESGKLTFTLPAASAAVLTVSLA